MRIAVVGIHTENYKPLADMTVKKNKAIYCQKQGYIPHFKIIDGSSYDNNSGFKKIEVILDLFASVPEIEWAFYTDCDAMVTNFTFKLESIISNLGSHTVVALCTDCNNINAGQFLIRNCDRGIKYLRHILSLKDRYKEHPWHEQEAMIENSWPFKDFVEILPQRTMNSYVYANHGTDIPIDILGQSGEWQPGDFIQHWPGYSFEKRLEIAQNTFAKVVF